MWSSYRPQGPLDFEYGEEINSVLQCLHSMGPFQVQVSRPPLQYTGWVVHLSVASGTSHYNKSDIWFPSDRFCSLHSFALWCKVGYARSILFHLKCNTMKTPLRHCKSLSHLWSPNLSRKVGGMVLKTVEKGLSLSPTSHATTLTISLSQKRIVKTVWSSESYLGMFWNNWSQTG